MSRKCSASGRAQLELATANRMIGTVERAFQLAPECSSREEIRRRLVREGHTNVDAHLQGKALRAELKKLLKP